MPSPIGHILCGAAGVWAADLVPGDRRWRTAPATASWYARAGNGFTLACAIVAATPDLDLLFRVHRMYTHSIGAVIFVGLLAAALAASARRPAARIGLMFAAAYLTHLFMDWLAVDQVTPAGLQALWPFSSDWYISGWDIFAQTERKDPLSLRAMAINLRAIAQEAAILLPVLAALWLVRVKALARLAPKPAGGHHPPQ